MYHHYIIRVFRIRIPLLVSFVLLSFHVDYQHHFISTEEHLLSFLIRHFLVVMYSLSFCLSREALILLLFVKDNLLDILFLVGSFFFSTLNILFFGTLILSWLAGFLRNLLIVLWQVMVWGGGFLICNELLFFFCFQNSVLLTFVNLIINNVSQ